MKKIFKSICVCMGSFVIVYGICVMWMDKVMYNISYKDSSGMVCIFCGTLVVLGSLIFIDRLKSDWSRKEWFKMNLIGSIHFPVLAIILLVALVIGKDDSNSIGYGICLRFCIWAMISTVLTGITYFIEKKKGNI
ncbi:MAG: hypothetical protein Q4C64_02725 [Erysipelotrichia bacterium]|nr:hypothetical protein [Erysipelotrichia bacterium]